MNAHLQPATSANRAESHSMSHHPAVRAVLKQGLNKLWTPKEVAQVLGLDERSAQMMMGKDGALPSSSYQIKRNGTRGRLCVNAGQLLLYILSHSRDVPEAEIIEALNVITDQLSDRVLQALADHCQKKILRRQGRAVVILREQPPSAGFTTGDLFCQ